MLIKRTNEEVSRRSLAVVDDTEFRMDVTLFGKQVNWDLPCCSLCMACYDTAVLCYIETGHSPSHSPTLQPWPRCPSPLLPSICWLLAILMPALSLL